MHSEICACKIIESPCSVDGPCNRLFCGEITLQLADFPFSATDVMGYKKVAVSPWFGVFFPSADLSVIILYSIVTMNKEWKVFWDLEYVVSNTIWYDSEEFALVI